MGELFSAEAERAVLATMLMSPSGGASVDLEENDFYHPLHRTVFATIAAIRNSGRAIDTIAVHDEFTRTGNKLAAEALLEIVGAFGGSAGISHWVEIVKRDNIRRKLISTCGDVSERAKAGDDIGELLEDARRALADLEAPSGTGPARLGDKMAEVIEAIDQRIGGKITHAVPSGITAFDDFCGGFRPGQLVVVAARPGIGKTALAGTIALHAARKQIPTLVFSLEMTFQEMAERFIGGAARFSVERLSRGDMDTSAFRRLYGDIRHLNTAPLWLDDRILTANQIVGTARSWRLRQQSELALIIVDYLGLIKPTGKSETRALEVGRMAWAMKLLAKETKTPVLLVSQLNRASEKEGRLPILADLRDSGEIEQHANTVIFPHRSEPLGESGEAKLIVAKNRGGRTGTVPCWWHADYMTFETMEGRDGV